ncbi:Glycosyl hydrolase family 63 C-terminal domain-containing protein [Catalinimonas alkaloidigena]|uniref:Glycosyl hydrolase family 63 C-terminal domain-containing protein n=1 Tax=Catalinimonas alkaloidigena TaxID=1075417 RepID=A0A1G9JDX1_9BACT|nr:glucosidase [Catalinimonas alkaloidigena]SDL35581.1 Glycosyl hydrolase family 63 C-terminal domain-containing protein [Catalinimonas alkaloidigena]
MTEEEKRLHEGPPTWRKWGTYLSERAWGTVREDYSANGDAWNFFPHDHARSRVYRWNEDGLLGFCDENQLLCFALALWNGQDPILKERFFGLTNSQGNHGEDVKEYFFYLDNTPTHAWCRALYKYPQRAFPYDHLVQENGRRTRNDPEFELMDTGIFAQNRYFDVEVVYAKAAPEDLLIEIRVTNQGPEEATLDVLPTLWFRNRWSWYRNGGAVARPQLRRLTTNPHEPLVIEAEQEELGKRWLLCQHDAHAELLFTENETNDQRLFGVPNATPYVKDAFHEYVIRGVQEAVNPAGVGTKAAVRYRLTVAPGATQTLRLRLTNRYPLSAALEAPFEAILAQRKQEADAFYQTVSPAGCHEDLQRIQRQALAGLLWSKQFYHYDLTRWLKGDSTQPRPPETRWQGRNHHWPHLNNRDLLLMPDPWEYPWYAAWDLAFHCIPMALIDADFAKQQLILLLREWYMHPNGQLPAYEWNFSDVNPPVHAWAALRVFRIERRLRGKGDTAFLEKVFHKLLLNFTWWVNRKDLEGHNLFQGGFLGLDNIGVFDRSAPLPDGGRLDQSDATAWMAMFCLNMLAISLELASQDPTYEDVATKFLEHFFYIAYAINDRPIASHRNEIDLWDNRDDFYYDVLHQPGQPPRYLRVRSLVGLIPLLAVDTIDDDLLKRLPHFADRMEWFMKNRPDLCANAASVSRRGKNERRLFSVVDEERLRKVLAYMLDENEFLSPYGLRSLSKFHQEHPYRLDLDNETHVVDYQPAESNSDLFGGNSNWRGPVWFPINYLLIEALQKFDYYYGESFKVEYPTGSGHELTLWEVSVELSKRMIGLFGRNAQGHRPVFGDNETFQHDPHWRDLIPFHEYFHGDNGAGLGASHQTGWTALVAKLIQQSGNRPSS